MPGSSSVEHLLTLTTWMMMKEENKSNGIFQTFDMEKFFDKESLRDVMYMLHNEAKICDIGCALKYTFRGTPSTRLGLMPLNSLIMQDDISKMNDRLENARSGCDKIDDTLKRKQLSVNYDKNKYLLIGSQKFRNEMLKTLVIDHSKKEKYLVDWIHEKGCRNSQCKPDRTGEQGRRNHSSVRSTNWSGMVIHWPCSNCMKHK